MKIEHIAIWTKDIERLRMYYEKYFDAISKAKYVNAEKQFESYFLSFHSDTRLELMYSPRVQELNNDENAQQAGYIHVAFSVGSKEQVDALTLKLQKDGYRILDGPRYTGDEYYESSSLIQTVIEFEITI